MLQVLFLIASTETPDRVLMSGENLTPSVVEGRNYNVECVVTNVAPVRNLHVSWHLGDRVLKTQTFDDSADTPVNKSSVLSLVANRNETGQMWCVAKLVFKAPAETTSAVPSNSVSLQVLCKFSLVVFP